LFNKKFQIRAINAAVPKANNLDINCENIPKNTTVLIDPIEFVAK
jgi:hypothetical protein